MNIMEVCGALRGAPHLIAARPRGLVIRRTDRGMFIKLSVVGRPYPWHPCGIDLEAIDWGVFTPAQYKKLIADQAAAEAQATAENGSNGEPGTAA